jgi:hypothetical protein
MFWPSAVPIGLSDVQVPAPFFVVVVTETRGSRNRCESAAVNKQAVDCPELWDLFAVLMKNLEFMGTCDL